MNSTTKDLYFVNPLIDFLFIGGLSIITFILMMIFLQDQEYAMILTVAAALTWICNNPHFAATTYRLYKTKENMMQFPFTSFVVPFIVLAATYAALGFPKTVAPFFIKFYFIWSPFHFSGQSFGVSMVYAKRAGYQLNNFQRQCLKVFIYSSFIAILLKLDMALANSDYHGFEYYAFNIPSWAYYTMMGIMTVSGVLVLFHAAQWSRKNKKRLPLIVLLPAITHIVWFIGGERHVAFDGLVPFFHSAQYLFIAWAMQTKDIAEKSQSESKKLSRKDTLFHTAKWFLVNCFVGAFMFEILPYLFPKFGGSAYGAFGIVIIGVQIHHFFVDGVIWKLKSQQNKSALFINSSDYLDFSQQGARL